MTFIESQLPVSRLSKECYKERKAGPGQTLTPLASYWKGRKPLILVRATILGCLLPATDNPAKDRDIFLKLLLMDDEGLQKRRIKAVPPAVIASHLNPEELGESIIDGKWARSVAREERARLQELAFSRMGYDEKLEYCARPEEMPEDAWHDVWPEVNPYLGTDARNMEQLVSQLGEKRFGRVPRVTDTFCGGGSIPFEAARMGCEVQASDLNPIAGMLTWGALHVVGGSAELGRRIRAEQLRVARAVRAEIDALGVESGKDDWRGKVYLYCVEVRCPQTGWLIPLAPGWVISATHKVIAKLVPNEANKRFEIEIVTGATDAEMEAAKLGTERDGYVHHPAFPNVQTKLTTIRGDVGGRASRNALRRWKREDFEPVPDDVFQERLYCVQWTRTVVTKTRTYIQTRFRSVTQDDLERERKVRETVRENMSQWQRKGLVPDMPIEPGEKTDEPIRTRGWTHWHHLFNARQLLTLALYKKHTDEIESPEIQGALAIVLTKALDWHSRLCRWDGNPGCDKVSNVFYNQAFNTLSNYGTRGTAYLENHTLNEVPTVSLHQAKTSIRVQSATLYSGTNDLAITDPPYGDAINYHEITEFFIAWLRGNPPTPFKDWTWDSRRALAVCGNDLHFRRTMVGAYQALANGMSPNGMQVVMFTHNDTDVWTGIAQILWAAGLQVTAAWSVGTETTGGVRQGNLIQGTVLLVLRKRQGEENGYSARLKPKMKEAAKQHLERMQALDDKQRPNFGDPDYQLAAYAAALEVLTRYKTLDGHDVGADFLHGSDSANSVKIRSLLDDMKRLASDFLIPADLGQPALEGRPALLKPREIWDNLSGDERFFLKGLEVERGNEVRLGAYQDLARGFGVQHHRDLMGSVSPNKARLKTAKEFRARDIRRRDSSDTAEDISLETFAAGVVRHALYGIYLAMDSGDLRVPMEWFGRSMPEYWERRKLLVSVLDYIARAKTAAREPEAAVALQLAGAVAGDSR